MPRRPSTASFIQQLSIPEAGIAAAVAVMRPGRLHRYNTAHGAESEAAGLERDDAVWQVVRHCLAFKPKGVA